MIKRGSAQRAPSFSAGDFLPPADNLYTLGSASYSWKEVHVETMVYATAVLGNWSPSATGTYTLGTASLGWLGAYFDAASGADADINILNLLVTGTPKLWWDESEDAFALTHGLNFASGKGINFDTCGIKITDTYIQFGNDTDALGPKLMYGSATQIKVYDAAGTTYAGLKFKALEIASAATPDGYITWDNNGIIKTNTADSKYVQFLATDDDGAAGAQLEIGRMVGANDPYFQFGGSGQFKFHNSGVATFGGTCTFNGDVVMGTMDIDDDSGAVTLVDMGVTATPADGTEQSIALKIDGNTLVKLYSEADHAGAVDTMRFESHVPISTTAEGDLTIATGAVAVTKTLHSIIVQGGAGSAADDLVTATGGSEGQFLILKPNTTKGGGDVDQVTVKHTAAANSFLLAGDADFVMDDVDDRLFLIHNGTSWVEIARASGA